MANRVGEIRESSEPHQWRHVPGKQNPADDCSRGLSATNLTSNHRWFKGPPFLSQPEDRWPSIVTQPEPDTEDPEISRPKWVKPDTYQTQQSCGRINHKKKRLVQVTKNCCLDIAIYIELSPINRIESFRSSSTAGVGVSPRDVYTSFPKDLLS